MEFNSAFKGLNHLYRTEKACI